MPQINLINERRKKEKRQLLSARLLLYGCYGCGVAIAAIALFSAAAVYRKNAAIEDVKGQLKVLQPVLAQVNDVQSQIATLEPKLRLLSNAKDSTLHWYLVYQQIGQALPTTSWLDNLSINRTDQAEQLALTGQSLSQDTVADMIEKLQSYPAFSSVTLNSITQPALAEQRKPGYHTVHFDLLVQLKGTQEAQNGKAPTQNKP